ncbi:hypothetical protein AM592_20845 [Bacillus gobiensis]|uniref:Uncharacterized protein n=2 Tax=Bacillus TaxID=1386 RepID=A0A0M4GCM6_9BACI|nr:hypothetical protein AM592_20845 [Bacillus gobiensis]MBP1082732.1 hypothetical protein [Bacillus capparidis]
MNKDNFKRIANIFGAFVILSLFVYDFSPESIKVYVKFFSFGMLTISYVFFTLNSGEKWVILLFAVSWFIIVFYAF